nr:uncharacterized protein LOC118094287 isoform X2 [Zootoca vivipara]
MAAAAEERTVRDRLADALEDLKEYDLKQFKFHLNALPAEEGYRSIPKGRLQKADVFDLYRLLLGYYAEDGAIEVTLKVLECINRRDLREKLLQVKGGGGGQLDGCFGQGQWQGGNRNIGGIGSSVACCGFPPFERDVASLRSLRDPSFSLRLFTSFDSCGMGDFRFASTRTEIVDGKSITRRRMVENGQERVDVEVDQSNTLAINESSATIGETETIASCKNLKIKVTEVLDGELSHLVETKDNMAGKVSSGTNTRRSIVMKTIRNCLLDTLENLEEYNFRKFRYHLNLLPVKEGYSNIPRGRLEKADCIDLTRLLLGYYTEHYAVEVVLMVLKSINRRDLERNLLEITEKDGWRGHGQWQCGNRNGDGSGSFVASCRFPSFGRDFTSLRYLRQGGLISFSLSLSASFDALGVGDFKCVSTSTEMVGGRKRIRKRMIENGQENEEVEDIDELNPLAIIGSPVMRFPEAAANFQNLRNELSHMLAGDVSVIEEEDLGREVSSGGAAKRSALCTSQNGETLPGAHAASKRTPGLEMFHEWIPQNCLKNLQHIGSGGFGTVFRAQHKEKGIVALKMFHRTNAPSANVSCIRQQALNEARFMDEASFAPIPRLYGLYEKGNEVGLVMEYVENGNLSGLLSSALPWALRIRILYQVALGIDFLHCLHPPRFHLDLKPSNILLDEALNVKVADFGLSKFGTSRRSPLPSESAEVSGGTLEYMPPEAFAESYKPDPATDVYSYGILMFSVLTGKEPYPSNPQRDTSIFGMQIQENQRPNTRELEGKIHEVEKLENLIGLMKRCWQKEKAQRPSFKVCSQEMEEIYSCYMPHIETAVREVQDSLAKAKALPLRVAEDQAGYQSRRMRPWSEVDCAMPCAMESKEDSERDASSITATKGSICLESLPSGEKPADRIKKSKGKLTENFALQRNREAFLNIAEEDGLLTKGECLCLSQMNDAQEFVGSLVNTVLGKIELMHDLFLYCLEKLKL